MPLAANSIVQLSYLSEWASQRVMLVRNFVVTANNSTQTVPADLGSILAKFSAGGAGTLLGSYLDCLAENVTVKKARVQAIYPLRTSYVEAPVGLAGLFTGDADWGQSCGVVTVRTDVAGRNQVGNVHVGPLADPTVVEGYLTEFVKLKLAALGANLAGSWSVTAGAGSISLSPVLFHTTAVPPSYSIITNASVQDTAREIRRRTVGAGI